MDFNPNKTPIQIIKEGAFGGTYFKMFNLTLIKNGIKIHGKNLFILKILMLNSMHQIIMT